MSNITATASRNLSKTSNLEEGEAPLIAAPEAGTTPTIYAILDNANGGLVDLGQAIDGMMDRVNSSGPDGGEEPTPPLITLESLAEEVAVRIAACLDKINKLSQTI